MLYSESCSTFDVLSLKNAVISIPVLSKFSPSIYSFFDGSLVTVILSSDGSIDWFIVNAFIVESALGISGFKELIFVKSVQLLLLKSDCDAMKHLLFDISISLYS